MLTIMLKDYSSNGRLLGIRDVALGIRDTAELALNKGVPVQFDFAGTNPTQSFVDELVGALVTDRGPNVLLDIVMLNCNDSVKNILHFVVSDRLDQLQGRQLQAEH